MKGIIFTTLEQLVEEKFNIETWNQILEKIDSQTNGVYTKSGTYPDAELIQIISELSIVSKISIGDLIKVYGEYLLSQLITLYPDFFDVPSLKFFLLSVNDHIHVEVKKLYPEAELPKFEYLDESEDRLTMIYRSSRKLPQLAEGLIAGAAKHFNASVEVEITEHNENSDNYFKFELSFLEKKD